MNEYIITLLISFTIQIIFFLIAFSFKTDKFTDFAYSITFMIITIYLLISNQITLLKIIISTLIILWAIRLLTYLVIRIKNIKKDKRFDKMRNSFIKFGSFWFLQAITVWIILLPSIYLLSKNAITKINLISIIGIIIWLIGFLFETIADYQKYIFKKTNKGIIKNGLWKYSRHPNYFGEILVWIGIFTITIPYQNNFSYLTIISPIFIIFLLVFVSGIPLLEKKQVNNPEYQKYKSKTSMLIPWIPK